MSGFLKAQWRAALMLILVIGMLFSPVSIGVGATQDATPTAPEAPIPTAPVATETPAPAPTVAPTTPPTEVITPPINPEPVETPPVPTAEPEIVESAPTEESIHTPTTEPEVTATPTEPIPPTPEPTVIVATPTVEPTVSAPSQNTDTLTLTHPANGTDTVTLDENGNLALSFDYAVTTDRASTTVNAKILDADGVPAEGWTVSLAPDGSPQLVESTHVTAGGVFPIKITMTGPNDQPHTTVHLILRSTVEMRVNTTDASDEPNSIPHEQPGATAQLEMQNREPNAMVAPASVENSGRLTCLNANTGFNVVDAVSPGETIEFHCTFSGVDLVSVLTGSVSLEGPAGDGWQIALRSTSLDLLGIDVAGGETPFARSHSISEAKLLNSGDAIFTVLVRAPMSVTDSNSSSTVSISARSCLLVVCTSGSATLVSHIDLTQAASGGGALLDGALLGQLTQPLGSALFSIECTDVTDQVISQGEPVAIDCSLRKLLSVGLVDGGVLSLDATLRIDTSLGPGVATFPESGSNILELSVGNIADLEVGGSIPFQLTVQPTCMTDVGNLHSVRVNADYSLNLVGGLLTADLTDGWATVPFTIAEGAPAAPMIANVSPVDFGSSMWNGTAYPAKDGELDITVDLPESGCLANDGTVTISGGKPLTSLNDQIDNEHITVTDISGNSTWGSAPVATGGNLTTTHTVFTVTDATAATSETTVTVTLNLQPPPGTSRGDYEGSISITTTPGPSAGE